MREGAKPFYVVFAIAAALVVPAAIALRTVIHPVILQATSDNPTPLGYTWSLLLFIIPIAALGGGLPAGPICSFREKHFGEPSPCSRQSVSCSTCSLATLSSFSQIKRRLSVAKYPQWVVRFRSRNSSSISPASCWCC